MGAFQIIVEHGLAHPDPILLIGDSTQPGVSLGETSQSSHTRNPSIHPYRYTKQLEPWKDFEADLDEVLGKITKEKDAWKKLRAKDPPKNKNALEVIRCGNEHSVSGRFSSNVLDPVLRALCSVRDKGAFDALGIKKDDLEPSLADWNTVTAVPINDADASSLDIHGKPESQTPDFAICSARAPSPRGNDVNAPLFPVGIGELKTPWTSEETFVKMVQIAWKREEFKQQQDFKVTRFLGQVAVYMQVYKQRYALLSNYNMSIAIKQEQDPGSRDWSLRLSPLILRDPANPPRQYMLISKFTNRMAVFYLLLRSHMDYKKLGEPNNLTQWVEYRQPEDQASTKGTIDIARSQKVAATVVGASSSSSTENIVRKGLTQLRLDEDDKLHALSISAGRVIVSDISNKRRSQDVERIEVNGNKMCSFVRRETTSRPFKLEIEQIKRDDEDNIRNARRNIAEWDVTVSKGLLYHRRDRGSWTRSTLRLLFAPSLGSGGHPALVGWLGSKAAQPFVFCKLITTPQEGI